MNWIEYTPPKSKESVSFQLNTVQEYQTFNCIKSQYNREFVHPEQYTNTHDIYKYTDTIKIRVFAKNLFFPMNLDRFPNQK